MSPLNDKPTLLFTPFAWRKLIFFRDQSSNEVGALGISGKNNPLLIRDLVIPKQRVTGVSIDFDTSDVADLYADLDGRGLSMNDYARIWIHTHPGSSPQPSGTDENTFDTNYGESDWAVMFILAQGGSAYARIRIRKPLTTQFLAGTGIDWSVPFQATDETTWSSVYKNKVSEVRYLDTTKNKNKTPLLGSPSEFQEARRPAFYEESVEAMDDSWWLDDGMDDCPPDSDEMSDKEYAAFRQKLYGELE